MSFRIEDDIREGIVFLYMIVRNGTESCGLKRFLKRTYFTLIIMLREAVRYDFDVRVAHFILLLIRKELLQLIGT